MQTPASHAVGAVQALPQAPQFASSELTSVHAAAHKFGADAGQAHPSPDAPDWHVWPPVQTVLQAPQWLAVRRLVHAPPQHPCDAAQTTPQPPQFFVSLPSLVQPPAQHDWPVAHARPHLPQLAESVCRFVQTFAPQYVSIDLGHTQLPPMQLSTGGHAVEHEPQAA
jgi:hypothetical protein